MFDPFVPQDSHRLKKRFFFSKFYFIKQFYRQRLAASSINTYISMYLSFQHPSVYLSIYLSTSLYLSIYLSFNIPLSIYLIYLGSVTGTFQSVARTVKDTLTESLLKLLTPKRRIDIIRDVMEVGAAGV